MINEVKKIFEKYEDNITRMWSRIDNEIKTPIVEYTNLEDDLKKKVAERKGYVIRERDRIVIDELGEAFEEVKKIVPKITIEGMMSLSKIILWGKKDKDDYWEGKLANYL